MKKHSIKLDDPSSFQYFAHDYIIFRGFDLDHDTALLETYLLSHFQFFQKRRIDKYFLIVFLCIFAVIDLYRLSRFDFDIHDVLDPDVGTSRLHHDGLAVVQLHDGVDVFLVVVIEPSRQGDPEDVDHIDDFGKHGLFGEGRTYAGDDLCEMEIVHGYV